MNKFFFLFLENYNVSIVVSSQDQKSSLTLTHSPTLKSKGNSKNVVVSVSFSTCIYPDGIVIDCYLLLPGTVIFFQTKRLCIETILNGTIQAQSLAKLEVSTQIFCN